MQYFKIFDTTATVRGSFTTLPAHASKGVDGKVAYSPVFPSRENKEENSSSRGSDAFNLYRHEDLCAQHPPFT